MGNIRHTTIIRLVRTRRNFNPLDNSDFIGWWRRSSSWPSKPWTKYYFWDRGSRWSSSSCSTTRFFIHASRQFLSFGVFFSFLYHCWNGVFPRRMCSRLLYRYYVWAHYAGKHTIVERVLSFSGLKIDLAMIPSSGRWN